MAAPAAIAKADPQLKAAMIDEAKKADSEVIDPLLQFRNYGLQLSDHWSTISNGAAFGTDYFSRTAVARSNIFVNQQKETKYFYQDLDKSGTRLNGQNGYTVTFAKGQLPPVKGFWSLTLYNEQHFFSPNELKLFDRHQKQIAASQYRWFADDLRAKRFAGQGQGKQLAADTKRRRFLAIHPRLLA